MKLKPIPFGERPDLGDEAARTVGKNGEGSDRSAEKETDRLGRLQHLLYADARYALLIVLQGRDASGKDGTIRKVFTAVDPQGCVVTAFGPPSALELRHDFLWRIHQAAPARGMIGIFNRSHYEDVLVPRVHGTIGRREWERRFAQIADFERMLSENGTVILKFFLHVSRDEQKRRLQERIRDREKNWKFRLGDLDDRRRWGDFTEAYRDAIAHTSTDAAPWHVVPADDKEIRNRLIARTVVDTLEALDLRYPEADPSVIRTIVE